MKNKIILFFIFFCFVGKIFGQSESDSSIYKINLISIYFNDENRVVLRWVPSSPGFWSLNNFYGYRIERREIDTSNTASDLEWTLLDTIQPLTLDKWKDLVKKNPTDTLLMVAGQAVHGSRDSSNANLYNMMEKADQIQNLYSACLLASEFSRNAALASALRYEDKDIQKGKSYVYRIMVNSNNYQHEYEVGVSMVRCVPFEFPKIKIAEIVSGEKTIDLLWDKIVNKEYYSAYNIYRSDDKGQTWKKRNDLPTSYLSYKNENRFVYQDSVPVNYQPYLYRIEGLTPFATKGPMSDNIEAMAKDRTKPEAPYNVQTEYLGGSRLKISWDVNSKDTDIAGFRISKSNEVDNNFIELTKEPLPSNSRSFIDENFNELKHNYYFIGVFDREGNVNVTSAIYGGYKDSIPPDKPKGLKGSIDSNGVVTVSWDLGKENDLKGYYVHFNNDGGKIFFNQTPKYITDTVWHDTIPLKVSTKKIYYKVVAIDHRSNYSEYSDVLVLTKPDIVPPAQPLFVRTESKKEGVEIRWYPSPSADVVEHILYRRLKGEQNYQEIKKFNYTIFNKEILTLDKDVVAGNKYEYKLKAIDESNLMSESPGTVTATAYIIKKLSDIESLSYQLDGDFNCLLSWKFPNIENVTFVIYRSVNQNSYAIYKSGIRDLRFTDKKYNSGQNVRYRVKAIHKDGRQSDFSNEIEVKW
ncbi:MAG: hypothetical protein M9888_08310 [Chitinophagales bacterium]|nr:hypothetical protein [Chitinophagales bacterium]